MPAFEVAQIFGFSTPEKANLKLREARADVFDKPLCKTAESGKPPVYLFEEPRVSFFSPATCNFKAHF